MWIGRLPGQRLRFVQSQAEKVFVRTDAKFGKDRLFDFLELGENFPASFHAGAGDQMSSKWIGFSSSDVRFHSSFPLVVVHLVKF